MSVFQGCICRHSVSIGWVPRPFLFILNWRSIGLMLTVSACTQNHSPAFVKLPFFVQSLLKVLIRSYYFVNFYVKADSNRENIFGASLAQVDWFCGLFRQSSTCQTYFPLFCVILDLVPAVSVSSASGRSRKDTSSLSTGSSEG